MNLGDIKNKQGVPAVHLKVLVLVTLQFSVKQFSVKHLLSLLFLSLCCFCYFGRSSLSHVEKMTPWGHVPQNERTILIIVSSSALT